jgi:phosphatidylglycerophosphate synthase
MPPGPTQPHGAPAMAKQVDAWWTVLVIDPVANRTVRALLPLQWVTPNRITLLSMLFGLASGFCFLAGDLVVGGILFQLRFFLDCLDGKVARARGVSSAAGAALDVTSDVLTVTWNYWALGIYVVHQDAAGPGLPAAVVALSLVWAWLILYRKNLQGPASARTTSIVSNEDSVVARYIRAMAGRRLQPTPWVVEAEVVALSLVPLLDSARLSALTLWGATAFYLVAATFNAARIWRITRSMPAAGLQLDDPTISAVRTIEDDQ